MDLLLCGGLALLEALAYGRLWPRGFDSYPQPTSGSLIENATVLFLGHYLFLKYYRIFLYHKYFSPLRHLPGPKDNHFFFGQSIKLFMAKTPTELYTKWMEEHPDAPFIRYLSIGNNEVLVPNNLNAHKEVLQNQCYSFHKPDFFLRMVKEIAGHGLVLMDGDEHKLHRKMVNGSFSLKNIRKLEPIFKDKAKDLARYWDQRIAENDGKTGSFDCINTFAKAILDIMGQALLGIDLDYVKPGQQKELQDGGLREGCTFHEAYNIFFSPGPLGKFLLVVNGWIPTRWLPLKTNRDFLYAMDWLNDVLINVIRDRYRDITKAIAAGTYEQKDSRDLVTYIVEEGLTGGAAREMGEREFLGHLLEFMAAGHDTSANMLSWSCYLMAINQDMQDRLREEISTLPDDPSYADLERLPYLENFCRESLRILCPATIYYRQTNHEVLIEGVRIPKDTLVDVCPAVTLLNPLIWGPDPGTPDPDRWDHLTPEQTSPYAFNAFSNGPRICIGRQFAMFEIKVIMVEMVRNFRLLAVEKPFEIENPSFTLRPAGLEVKIERIK